MKRRYNCEMNESSDPVRITSYWYKLKVCFQVFLSSPPIYSLQMYNFFEQGPNCGTSCILTSPSQLSFLLSYVDIITPLCLQSKIMSCI
jgi:hypothetical protein